MGHALGLLSGSYVDYVKCVDASGSAPTRLTPSLHSRWPHSQRLPITGVIFTNQSAQPINHARGAHHHRRQYRMDNQLSCQLFFRRRRTPERRRHRQPFRDDPGLRGIRSAELAIACSQTGNAPNSASYSPVTIQVSAATSSGPIGDWPFDEDSGAFAHDSSGNGQTATINGATWTPPNGGKINSALNFIVTTGVITPPVALGNTFTISAWVNPAVVPQTSYGRIAETSYASGFYLGTDVSGTKYKMIVNNGAA